MVWTNFGYYYEKNEDVVFSKGKFLGKEYKNYNAVEFTGVTKVNGEVKDISRRVFKGLILITSESILILV
jgi:hypothetical protein